MKKIAFTWVALAIVAQSTVSEAQTYSDYWIGSLRDTLVGLEADSQASLEVWRTIQDPPYLTRRVNTWILGTHGSTVHPRYSSTSPATNYSVIVKFVGLFPGNWNNAFIALDVPVEHCIWSRLQGSVQPGQEAAYPEPATYYKEVPAQCTRERVEADKDKTYCPILLDLDRDGYQLTAASAGVAFDIDADGFKERIAWTSPGDDAFLCWDRNQNGLIDDGTELFGWATPLASGQNAGNGFAALEELDQPALGGDSDGELTEKDAAWTHLCTWRDSNHDAVSQVAEIVRLADLDVVALGYAYTTSQRQDRYGNVFRYASSMRASTKNGQQKSWPMYDIVFAD